MPAVDTPWRSSFTSGPSTTESEAPAASTNGTAAPVGAKMYAPEGWPEVTDEYTYICCDTAALSELRCVCWRDRESGGDNRARGGGY